jgi:HK97 family phage portal protein
MGILGRAVKEAFNQGTGAVGGWAGIRAQVNSAGVAVTHRRAMQVGGYQTAVRVISEDVAGVPLLVYRRTDGGGRDRAADHPSYSTLHDAPNPEMTSFVFRETLQGHVLGWGYCAAEMVRTRGMVTEMWPLRPDRIEAKRDEATGRLFYRYQLPTGEPRDLRRDQVFFMPGLGFDGITGYPFLTWLAREVLGIAIAQQDYVGRFYANDARPGIYLKHPGKISDDARRNLKVSWDENHAGLSNAHRTAVLEEGISIDTVGVSPIEQQLLDSRKWSATEIGGMLRLAPWKVGVYDRATWGNVEDGNIDHWQSALRAWFVRWEQQLNLQVLGIGTGYFAEHLIDGILRGNAESRARYYWSMRQAGALTADEIRDRENLNRRGGDADTLLAPQNMAPIDLLRELIAGKTGDAAPAQEPAR